MVLNKKLHFQHKYIWFNLLNVCLERAWYVVQPPFCRGGFSAKSAAIFAPFFLQTRLCFLNLGESNRNQIIFTISDWFGRKRYTVWCQINPKSVITIRIWFDSTIFRISFMQSCIQVDMFCLDFQNVSGPHTWSGCKDKQSWHLARAFFTKYPLKHFHYPINIQFPQINK